MKNLSELSQIELCNINGGNQLIYGLGYAVGTVLKSIIIAFEFSEIF